MQTEIPQLINKGHSEADHLSFENYSISKRKSMSGGLRTIAETHEYWQQKGGRTEMYQSLQNFDNSIS
jgi:hypothetical protein